MIHKFAKLIKGEATFPEADQIFTVGNNSKLIKLQEDQVIMFYHVAQL